MWGEDTTKNPKMEIPNNNFYSSSSFSNNAAAPSTNGDDASGGGTRQLRPARRGGGGGSSSSDSSNNRGGSWYDDDNDDNNFGWQQQQQQGRGRKDVVSNSSGAGWYDDDNDDQSTIRRGGGGRGGFRDNRRGDGGFLRGRGDGRGRGGVGRGGGDNNYYPRDRSSGGRRFDGSRGVGGRNTNKNNRGGRDDFYGSSSSGEKGRDHRQGQRDATSTTATTVFGATSSSSSIGKINLKAIENAGYEHLYGIAPVLNALKAKMRTLSTTSESDSDDDEQGENRKRLLELVDGFDDEDEIDVDGDEYDNNDRLKKTLTKTVKPEAKLSPHLFVQEGMLDIHSLGKRWSSNSNNLNSRKSGRSTAKKEASLEIIALAQSYDNCDDGDDAGGGGLPIVEVDKGVLNTLSGNRPHQGFVLRCGGLDFEPVRKLPLPPKVGQRVIGGNPSLWLALDEVVDPQNLGALLRSAYFLGRGAGIITDNDDYHNSFDDGRRRGKVGILVCSKNSSPLSPTVSAASAGALEFMTIYSTTNLPKLLINARDEGWRILGAAAADADSVGRGDSNNQDDDEDEEDAGNAHSWVLGDNDNIDISTEDVPINQRKKLQQQTRCYELDEVETGYPTILVLGSEGRGLRTLVARACTGFVSIPGGGVAVAGGCVMDDDDNDCETPTQAGVDSLNVSVTGGILLWHFLSKH